MCRCGDRELTLMLVAFFSSAGRCHFRRKLFTDEGDAGSLTGNHSTAVTQIPNDPIQRRGNRHRESSFGCRCRQFLRLILIHPQPHRESHDHQRIGVPRGRLGESLDSHGRQLDTRQSTPRQHFRIRRRLFRRSGQPALERNTIVRSGPIDQWGYAVIHCSVSTSTPHRRSQRRLHRRHTTPSLHFRRPGSRRGRTSNLSPAIFTAACWPRTRHRAKVDITVPASRSISNSPTDTCC